MGVQSLSLAEAAPSGLEGEVLLWVLARQFCKIVCSHVHLAKHGLLPRESETGEQHGIERELVTTETDEHAGKVRSPGRQVGHT